MSGSLSTTLRLVRCPRCHVHLPEPANVPKYKCGGCNTLLRARFKPQETQSQGVPHGRGKKPDSEKIVDVRSKERFMSNSFLNRKNMLKAVKENEVNDKESVKVCTRPESEPAFMELTSCSYRFDDLDDDDDDYDYGGGGDDDDDDGMLPNLKDKESVKENKVNDKESVKVCTRPESEPAFTELTSASYEFDDLDDDDDGTLPNLKDKQGLVVPKFGDWVSGENGPNYSTYYNKAVEDRVAGKIINPNDIPQQNQLMFPHSTWTRLEPEPIRKGVRGCTDMRQVSREDGEFMQVNESAARNENRDRRAARDLSRQQRHGVREGGPGGHPVNQNVESQQNIDRSLHQPRTKSANRDDEIYDFFMKKDDLRVLFRRGEKPDAEMSFDVRSKENKDNNKALVKVYYTKRVGKEGCWDSMELEHPATLEELGMDPENKGIISDFFGFVKANELCKRIGQPSRKDNCLVYEYPSTGRWRIIAAMANYLQFGIYHLDLTSFSCFAELEYMLCSTRNRSIIAIEGLYHCAWMPLNLKTDESAVQCLAQKIGALFLRPDNERIFVFTTNHVDQHDAASLRSVKMDIYTHMSLPRPMALPDGGKRTYHNGLLVSNSEEENMRAAYDSRKRYSLPNFDAIENKAVKVYSRWGRGYSHSMELEPPPTLAELGKDPENEGIISDLLSFVRDKELYKRIGKKWKRGYLLYDSPGTDRSSLIAVMANCLEFDIYDLDLTDLSSICELQNVLLCNRDRSLIAIKDFDHWFGMHPNLKDEVFSLRKENELTLSGLFEIIDGLVSCCWDQQLIVLTTNHNHRDRFHTALLHPLNIDAYMYTSSPQPIALPDGGEIVQLDSLEQKPSVDFDATNNRAYDSRTRISLTDFDVPDCRADLVRAYQSTPIMFTSENKDTRGGLNGECLTKNVLNDDLTKQELLPERTSLAFTKLTSEDIDGFYDSISVDSDSDSDKFDYGARMLSNLKDEVVDGLSSSCCDERITVSTTNNRDPRDAALLPLVNRDTDIHTASPQPIALLDGGEIVQLESIEQKSLVDFDATNNRAYQSSVLVSSEKKNTIEAYKGQWESLIQRTKRDMGEGLNEECLTKSALGLDDSTEQNSVDPRRGRGHLHSMEHEQPATFAKLGTDPQNEAIVSDLLKFVREKELYKRVGKAWKRGYLLYDPPCKDRSSLMAYVANRLEFDIHDLDLTGLSSIEELTNVLVSIGNRSLIVIKDIDHCVEMLPNLKSELTLSGLLEIIHGLLSSYGDARIIILTTNHNHIDKVYASLLHPLNIDLYVHTPSPQPIAVPDGGEIVQLDSSEQKPSEDFDAANNRAYQSGVLVSNSEKQSTREASRRQCMPESVLSLVDSTTRISSTDFDAPNNSAHLAWAYQSGPIGFNLEKKDLGKGLNLTKSVLILDDSSRQKLLPDVEATKNRGEALKRECITKSILGLEDLQQHFGGRRDDAAKNFGGIYDPGIHTTDSLARKSFKVVETLPIREQCNDYVPLLSIGGLTLDSWVQEEKSPNLARVLQINIVEQRVTKLPICLEELTSKSASSSRWPIGLPDGRHIVVLDPLEQSTKNIAHAVWVDQCSPTVSLPEKKVVRKTLKRKCRTMSGIIEIHQQHFGRRCEGSAKSFRATRIGRKHGTNRISIVKRIHKQHGIHQWTFRQKWATRKGYSAGDKSSFEVSSLSMTEKLDSRFQFIHMSQCAKADESGPTVPNSEKGSMREALKRDSLKDLRQHFGARRKDAAKGARRKHFDSLAWKSFEVLDSLPLAEQSKSIRNLAWRRTLTHKHCVRLKKSKDLPRSLLSDCSGELAAQSAIGLTDGEHIPSLSEKKIVRKTLKRKCKNMSILSSEEHQQHVGRRWEDDAKFLGMKRICRRLVIHREFTAKRIHWQHGICRLPFKQSTISLPDGGHILPLSKKKIARKTLKRKCRTVSILSLEYHQHVDSRWEDVVNGLGTKRVCRQLVIHLVCMVKRIRKQHGIHWWPFQQNWATMKGYPLGDGRPAKVISLSMDGKLVSRLQLIHISWLGRFSPRPLAVPGGGESVGPIALSASEFVGTNNRADRVGQDQSGSTSSHSKKKRTREQEDLREINKSITLNDLQQHYGRKREDASESLGVSVSTLKRICRQHGIKRWPYEPRNKAVKKPPDKHGGMNTSETCKTLSTNSSNPASSQPMPTMSHTGGSSEDQRNLLASQGEPFLQGHVSRPINGTISSCTDPTPSQPVPTVPHTTGSLEDQRNLLALPGEPLPSQLMPTIPPTMDGLEHWNDLSAFLDDPIPEGHASGSIDCTVPSCCDPALSQPMPTIAHTMPAIPLMMPLLTERQDMGSMKLKATYGDTTIKLRLPPLFGISELKEEVSKRRESGLGSYKIEYKDVDGIWTWIACNDDIRDYLELLASLGNQVIQLRVRDSPNTLICCQFCGSLNG